MKLHGFNVLMSLYHAEKAAYLEECFISLNEQDLKASEVILVIDGPISLELHNIIDKWVDILNIKVLIICSLV